MKFCCTFGCHDLQRAPSIFSDYLYDFIIRCLISVGQSGEVHRGPEVGRDLLGAAAVILEAFVGLFHGVRVPIPSHHADRQASQHGIQMPWNVNRFE